MECSKKYFILSQWSSMCMMTFSEGAKSYLPQIKSTVRKSAPNTMVCWLWNIAPETSPMALEKTWISRRQEGARRRYLLCLATNYSIGHCWFLFTLCWPFTLQSSLFSCDLQPRVHAVCHLLGSALADRCTQENRQYYIQRNAHQPAVPAENRKIVCFLTLHFRINKNYMSWDPGVKHDPNKLDFNKRLFPLYIMETGKWACRNDPICRSLFHPFQLGGSNTDVQYNAFCNAFVPTFLQRIIWGHHAVVGEKPWAVLLSYEVDVYGLTYEGLFLELGASWSLYLPIQEQETPPVFLGVRV